MSSKTAPKIDHAPVSRLDSPDLIPVNFRIKPSLKRALDSRPTEQALAQTIRDALTFAVHLTDYQLRTLTLMSPAQVQDLLAKVPAGDLLTGSGVGTD